MLLRAPSSYPYLTGLAKSIQAFAGFSAVVKPGTFSGAAALVRHLPLSPVASTGSAEQACVRVPGSSTDTFLGIFCAQAGGEMQGLQGTSQLQARR